MGPCGMPTDDGTDSPTVGVDIGAFVRRVLMFETYVVESYRFLEAPALAQAFGIAGLQTLIESGCIKFKCEMSAVGSHKPGGRPTATGTVNLVSVESANPKAYTSRCLENVQNVPRSTMKEGIRLKRAFVDALVRPPPGGGERVIASTMKDVADRDLLTLALVHAAAHRASVKIPESSVECSAEILNSSTVKVQSNIDRFIADETTRHTVIEAAVLAIARINQQLEKMHAFTALTGSADADLQLMTRKLTTLARELDSKQTERQFERVLEIRGFPSLNPDVKVDAKRLLAVRGSPECIAFRQWLLKTEDLSDADIAEVVGDLRSQLGEAVDTVPGKAMRLLLTTVAGNLPMVGPVIGPALSVLDTFVLGSILSKSGPAVFISSKYPSIFRR